MGRTLNEDDVLKEIGRWIGYLDEDMITRIKISIKKIPSTQPYTDEEIQKMQDLEQAELDKAFELGKEEGRKEAQPEPQWIPCSERLPDEYKRVLVSDVFGVYVGEFVDAEENWGGKHFIDAHGIHSISVKAWQPLPEPYREEGEE